MLADEAATPRDYTNLQGGKWETRGFINPFGQRVDLVLQIDLIKGGEVVGMYTRTGDANDVTPFSAKIGSLPDGNLRFNIKSGMGLLECHLQNDGSFSCNNGAVLKRTGVSQK